MIISFIEETIAAAIIGIIIERLIRKTTNYIYHNDEDIHLEYHAQNTQEEIVIVSDKDNNKLFKFSNYI